MVTSINGSGIAAYKFNAQSGSQNQPKSETSITSQQQNNAVAQTGADQVSISQAGKNLALKGFKPTVDVTDAKAVAKEHLAQQKLAYEQKYGLATASADQNVAASSKKTPLDLTDTKAVAKAHLAQQKLAYEKANGINTASSTGKSSAPVNLTQTPVDLTDTKAVAKEHLARQKREYEQNQPTATMANNFDQQRSDAIQNYLAVRKLNGI